MWFVVCAALAAAGGCTCGEPAIAVDLTVDSRATTTPCVKVVAVPDGAPEQPSGAIPRLPGKDAFEVAIYQRDLPQTIHVLARGFEDPGCTRVNEESPSAEVTFARGQVPHVPLHLNGSPCIGADAGIACPSGVCRSDHACADAGTEPDCTNNVDDDLDGKPDCLDPDCFDVACNASPNRCMTATKCLADGGCGSTTFKSCDTPTAFCLGAPGTCNPSTGDCSYAPDAGIACFDSNPCTNPDHCLLDAGCGGEPIVCNSPPSVCFNGIGTCSPSTGCSYPVNVGGGCDDGNLCTVQDRCSADAGCAGTLYSCQPSQCTNAGSCLGDGGCSVGSAKTGQLCDGGTGVCNASAACLGFPYVPSNFSPGQIAPTLVLADGGLPGAVTLNCPAWFNSTDAGISWCPGQPLPSVTAITQTGSSTAAVVLGMTGLTVNSSLTVFGNRPVIVAVWGDVTVAGAGLVSARSAMGFDAGAGSNPSGSCGQQDGLVASSSVGSGGGGGAFGTAGGNAGDLTGTGGANGGNGGSSTGNTTITPLRGGCPGGAGGRPNDTSASGSGGGAGGGAIQISAAGLLSISGTVTASGAGGQGGLRDQLSSSSEGGNGGGGGGSGGAVLLEGQDVLIPAGARLTSNGGGGGEGGDGNAGNNNGDPGSDGPTTTAAGGAGGSAQVSCASDGTTGGSSAGAPTAATNVTFTSGGCATGAGGGSAGRIRVNGHASCSVTSTVLSPTPTYGAPCP